MFSFLRPDKDSRRDKVSFRRGNSMVEFTLLLPWFVFLFIGTIDMGFYCYALIAVQGAARVACTYTALNNLPNDQANACRYALGQLADLPNFPGASYACTAAPITVTAQPVTGPDGQSAAEVVVTYVPPALSGIPNILPGQPTITRTVIMKL
jgi:Flp pilus assembly protein TadG